MKRALLFIITIVLSIFLLGCSSTDTVLSGKVSDSITGFPIEKAIVCDGNYGSGNMGVTDNLGNYSYSTYCEEHTIAISAEGYISQTKTIITPVIPNNVPLVINIELVKK